jgi:16S rRNA pseudouridine516 synthase
VTNHGQIRIDRLLSNLGYCSRKEAAALCRAGRLTLAGMALTDATAPIAVAEARTGGLRLDGAALDPPPPLTLMLHKPAGYTCSRDEAGPLIYDLLPARWRRRKPALSSIGRLDKASSGQLLITDDGALLHRITHPRTHAAKHYRVVTRLPLRGDEAALFASGEFRIGGDPKPLRPALWVPESASGGVMTLTEGRYHQIRRMFAALGNEVLALHRFQTGDLALGDLEAGRYRILTAAETDAALGGREPRDAPAGWPAPAKQADGQAPDILKTNK